MTKISDLTIADLKQIQKLLSQKQKLQGQIASLEQRLESFGSGSKAPAPRRARGKARSKTKAKPAAQRASRKRGSLKNSIIKALQAAGPAGIHIKDLAKKVRNKEANVRTWFFTTGKNIKNIKKAGRAKYGWEG